MTQTTNWEWYTCYISDEYREYSGSMTKTREEGIEHAIKHLPKDEFHFFIMLSNPENFNEHVQTSYITLKEDENGNRSIDSVMNEEDSEKLYEELSNKRFFQR